tara:strand:+ start:1294 stop:1452 length:159 start_codon:yes stop_codon:yes gene_type:complete
MPYVNVKVAGNLSDEQRRDIISEITKTLEKVAGNHLHQRMYKLTKYPEINGV